MAIKRPFVKLTIEKTEFFNDFWVLSRVEHDNKEWLEHLHDEIGRYGVWCLSRRLEKYTDVEGHSYEWRAIAEGLENKKDVDYKRCGIKWVPTGVKIFSPRNSHTFPIVDHKSAKYLAKEIRKKLANAKTSCGTNGT